MRIVCNVLNEMKKKNIILFQFTSSSLLQLCSSLQNTCSFYKASAILPNFHDSRKTAAFFARNQVVNQKQLFLHEQNIQKIIRRRKKEESPNGAFSILNEPPPLAERFQCNANRDQALRWLSCGEKTRLFLVKVWKRNTREKEREEGKGKFFTGFFCRVRTVKRIFPGETLDVETLAGSSIDLLARFSVSRLVSKPSLAARFLEFADEFDQLEAGNQRFPGESVSIILSIYLFLFFFFSQKSSSMY